MGEEYRIRLDDADRHTIVVALAEHLRRRVRAAKRTTNIQSEAALLERLAQPFARRPHSAWWAWGWSKGDKRDVYKRIEELTLESKGTVKPGKENII